MAVKGLLILESLPASFKCVPSHLSWEIQVVGVCLRSFTHAGLVGQEDLEWRWHFWPSLSMFWHFNMLLDFSHHQASSVTPCTSSSFTSSCCTWVYEWALSVKVIFFLWDDFFLHSLLIKLGRSWCKTLMYKSTKNLLVWWKCLSVLNQICMAK